MNEHAPGGGRGDRGDDVARLDDDLVDGRFWVVGEGESVVLDVRDGGRGRGADAEDIGDGVRGEEGGRGRGAWPEVEIGGSTRMAASPLPDLLAAAFFFGGMLDAECGSLGPRMEIETHRVESVTPATPLCIRQLG